MSNIVVSEEQILNAEECRVIQRTNLRNQGVPCADDEDMRSLVNKTDDIQGWVKFLTNTLSGYITDDTITTITSTTFQNQSLLEGASLDTLGSLPTQAFRYCSCFKWFYAKTLMTIATDGNGVNIFGTNNTLEHFIVPSVSSVGGYSLGWNNPISTALKLADLGLFSEINNNIAFANSNLKYLMMRKQDGIVTLGNVNKFTNTSPLSFVPQAQISNYESGTNWSATNCTFLALEGSRFENYDWADSVYNRDGTPKNTCTLDGNLIETADNETVAIFKHTENISHCYENGVELQDTDLVKGKTLTSTI